MAKENPGFRPVATFFVNRDPFYGGSKPGMETMRWLTRNGFEVANHTTNHKDLRTTDQGEVAKEIGTDEKMIEDATGQPSTTFAFPFGSLSHRAPRLGTARHQAGEVGLRRACSWPAGSRRTRRYVQLLRPAADPADPGQGKNQGR